MSRHQVETRAHRRADTARRRRDAIGTLDDPRLRHLTGDRADTVPVDAVHALDLGRIGGITLGHSHRWPHGGRGFSVHRQSEPVAHHGMTLVLRRRIVFVSVHRHP